MRPSAPCASAASSSDLSGRPAGAAVRRRAREILPGPSSYHAPPDGVCRLLAPRGLVESRGSRGVDEPQRGVTAARAGRRDVPPVGVGSERSLHRVGLVVAGDEEPHLVAALEALEGETDAIGWRLGRVVHGNRDGVGKPLGGVVREERRYVTVGTHAEEHDVPGLLAVLPDRPAVRLGAGLGALGPVGAGHPVHLRRVETQRAQARLVVLGVVAIGVAGREVALVAVAFAAVAFFVVAFFAAVVFVAVALFAVVLFAVDFVAVDVAAEVEA